MLKLLTKEQSDRIKELKKQFQPYADEGWIVESPDYNFLCFFKSGDDDEHFVSCDYSGRLISVFGTTRLHAQAIVNAYLPHFIYANHC